MRCGACSAARQCDVNLATRCPYVDDGLQCWGPQKLPLPPRDGSDEAVCECFGGGGAGLTEKRRETQ